MSDYNDAIQADIACFLKILLFILLGSIIYAICVTIYTCCKKKQIRKQVSDLANNTLEMSPEQFMKMRKASFGGRGRPSYALSHNFAGVYILHNVTKDMYYVGQGKEVLNRVNQHFAGRGNGDVYADYKYGDKFTIKMLSLENSGLSSLNELERYTIMVYDACNSGYNKTRGNR